MKREVSEKTLEINICAELLARIRALPGCGGAVWIGMKQDQEFRNGLDELLRNAPGHHLMLQFKSPQPDPPDTLPYRFAIAGKQLSCLRRLAGLHPNAVHYVFPFFNTLKRTQATAPNLLSDTWFLRVAMVPPGNLHHADCSPGTAMIYSEATKAVLSNWSNLAERSDALKKESVPSGALREWIWDVSKEFRGPQAGQIFRGLGSIFIPT